MSKQQHRLGVSEVNLVVRHLKITKYDDNSIRSAMKEINELDGLDDISFDQKSGVLNLAYDAAQRNIEEIEDLLKRYKIELGRDWWTRFKEGYYKFVDQNVKDNAKHRPTCCNRTPTEAKKNER